MKRGGIQDWFPGAILASKKMPETTYKLGWNQVESGVVFPGFRSAVSALRLLANKRMPDE